LQLITLETPRRRRVAGVFLRRIRYATGLYSFSGESFHESTTDFGLPGSVKLRTGRREIEDVDRHLSFRIDKGDLDVALLVSKHGTDSV
jgi:hypothetical protein